jgi:hypothetical protein
MTARNSPSLATFTSNEAELFFGRSLAGQNLFQQIQSIWDQDYQALSLIGPVDSGKSSLIQASLLPLLQQTDQNWHILNFSCCQADVYNHLLKTVLEGLPADAGEGLDVERLLTQLQEQPEKTEVLLQTSLQLTATHADDKAIAILLIIDPLEAIFQKITRQLNKHNFLSYCKFLQESTVLPF